MQNFILDNSETEQKFQKILKGIQSMQNGITAESMNQRGIIYSQNWGVSIVDLKEYSKSFEKDHLLALKLWNKQWRESMIMATLLENPAEMSEQQMDVWVKSFENSEIAEQAVMNLFPFSKFGFIKALEWCRGKKYLMKYTGVLMIGRLALLSEDIDEMFESFFDVLPPLTKDVTLSVVINRSLCMLAQRSPQLNTLCIEFAKELCDSESEVARNLGTELLEIIDFKA